MIKDSFKKIFQYTYKQNTKKVYKYKYLQPSPSKYQDSKHFQGKYYLKHFASKKCDIKKKYCKLYCKTAFKVVKQFGLQWE